MGDVALNSALILRSRSARSGVSKDAAGLPETSGSSFETPAARAPQDEAERGHRPTGSLTRAAIVTAARKWIGTPYVHQASCRGAGADCLGLVRGVFRDLYGYEPEIPPPYTADWAEQFGAETLRDAARRHLIEIATADFQAGDVLLFRFRKGPAKHCAIAAPGGNILHAYDRHAVHECALPDPWRRRLAFAFRFPGIEV